MTSLYPKFIHDGDLSPEAFGSDIDLTCQEIQGACKGFGTDEKRLLKAMGSMTPEERCMVPIRFKQLFKKSLVDVVASECGNKDFGTALQFLAVNPVEAECLMLGKAAKGVGTDELLLCTIVCGRTNKELEILKVNRARLIASIVPFCIEVAKIHVPCLFLSCAENILRHDYQRSWAQT
jgi:Annexin